MIPLNDCVSPALGALLRCQPTSDAKIAFAWRTAVGTSMARVSHVELQTDGLLIVTVEDKQWRQEMRRVKPMISPRLDALLGRGVVARIDVRAPTRESPPTR